MSPWTLGFHNSWCLLLLNSLLGKLLNTLLEDPIKTVTLSPGCRSMWLATWGCTTSSGGTQEPNQCGGKKRLLASFIILQLSGQWQQTSFLFHLSLCVFSLPSSPRVCSSFYESQIETQSFMIFWQKVLQQWSWGWWREWGGVFCIGNWGELKRGEWKRGVTIQTLPPSARMRSKENLCCQLCVFLFGKKKRSLDGVWRGIELDVIHGLLFQFLMPARQTSTFLQLLPLLSLSYTPALPIVYVQMEGFMQEPIMYLTYLLC